MNVEKVMEKLMSKLFQRKKYATKEKKIKNIEKLMELSFIRKIMNNSENFEDSDLSLSSGEE